MMFKKNYYYYYFYYYYYYYYLKYLPLKASQLREPIRLFFRSIRDDDYYHHYYYNYKYYKCFVTHMEFVYCVLFWELLGFSWMMSDKSDVILQILNIFKMYHSLFQSNKAICTKDGIASSC